MRRAFLASCLIAPALAAAAPGPAAAAPYKPDAKASARMLQILEKSVAFKTVKGQGQVEPYARYLAGLLTAGGFAPADVQVEPMGDTAMLIARYRGTGKGKPILLSGHMDVVEARPEDWERDPFTPVKENGFLFGRGSSDDKFGIALMVATLIQLKQEGFKPRRDLVLALSGDEETGMVTTRALAQRLKGAELLLNSDAGGGLLDEAGKPLLYGIQAAEKTYADIVVSFTNAGGHSSRPNKDNAIYSLARAIDRVAAFAFPPQANELTRAYFVATAAKTPGPLGEAMKRYAANPGDAEAAALLSAEPEFVGQVRTTCVATMAQAGHAENALPQKASVNVNCRIFPGVPVETVRAEIERVIADPSATVTVQGSPAFADASPLRPDVMKALRKAVDARVPGLPIVPHMSAGATDSLHFRAAGIPSYGVGGIFIKSSDQYAHGLNERVPLDSIDGALAQWHMLLTELAK